MFLLSNFKRNGMVCAAVLLLCAPVFAQSWKPEKPVDIIIGTTPGGRRAWCR